MGRQKDNEFQDISEDRISLARLVERERKNHKRPNEERIRFEIKKVAINVDTITSARHKISRAGVHRTLEPPRYWVTDKDEPAALILAGFRKAHVLNQSIIGAPFDGEVPEKENVVSVYFDGTP